MTDEELIFKIRGGDSAAQNELLNRYSPRVKAISSRFFIQGGEREDLVQEGMVGLFSAINSYTAGNVTFSAYASTCIRNAVLDAIKKNLGAKQSALNNFVPIVEIGEAEYPVSPEDELIRSENKLEFLQKISKILSSFEFKIIVMYLEGMSVTDISTAVDKPQKSVSNALSRAKIKLEKLYLKEN